MLNSPVRPVAVYDSANHRFVIAPLFPENHMGVAQALQIIKRTEIVGMGLVTWRFLADFCDMKQSHVFKAAYQGNRGYRQYIDQVRRHLVIDSTENKAYLYHHSYLPESVAPQHIGPTILNNQVDTLEMVAGIPCLITTRLSIKYPKQRQLTMTLTPTNGYLMGVRDVTLALPDQKYIVAGGVRALNDLLAKLRFVPTKEGATQLVIMVDDGAKEMNSVASTTVEGEAAAGTVKSEPKLVLPESPAVTLGEICSFDPITVEDEDDKPLAVRITPFGCNLVGFKYSVEILTPGHVRNIYGRPETINEDLSTLKIIPLQENAQIGIELHGGSEIIRQYLTFEVSEPAEEEQPDTPPQEGEEGDGPAEGDEETQSPEAAPIMTTSLEDGAEPAAMTPEVQAAAAQVEDDAPRYLECDWTVNLMAAPEQVFAMPLDVTPVQFDKVYTLNIRPISCSVQTPDGQNITHNHTVTLQGTASELHEILTHATVKMGTTKNARLDISGDVVDPNDHSKNTFSIPINILNTEA